MRYLSVDFFRGMVVAFMIIVNSPGTWEAVYAPLRHANWHGFTPTDLVFPSFMFIIGVSMWFSFEKFGRKLKPEILKKIIRRTVILFAIGLILNNFPFLWKNWDTWRIMGVPQRLALGYGLGAVLCLSFSKKILLYVAAGFLVIYQIFIFNFGEPGTNPLGLETNAVLRLDRWVFGAKHLYMGEGLPFDPEGILSTLPAIVTVILGWLTGNLFEFRKEKQGLLVRDLIFYGIVCIVVGLAWDLFFPINKKLWTSSFVLFAGGLSMTLLAGCVWLIDGLGFRNGTGFFLAFGKNPLFAYILSEAVLIGLFSIKMIRADGEPTNLQAWIYENVFVGVGSPEFSSLLFALIYMLFCWLICRFLMVRKILIKI